MKSNESNLGFQSSGAIAIAIIAIIIISIALSLVVKSRRTADAQLRVACSFNNQYSVNNGRGAYCPIARQQGSYPAYTYYPRSIPVQQVASNTLSLPMGVTLAGKGAVVSVMPGSPAEQAGLKVGDIINRINGR